MIIQLSQGKTAEIDDSDWPLVADFNWYTQKHRHTFYAIANVRLADGRRTTVKMHRIILGLAAGVQCDHDNGDGLCNRRWNIRAATHGQNQRNQHAIRAASGVMGVYRTRSGAYQAQMKLRGRTIGLGTYASTEAAGAAVLAAKLEARNVA